MRDGDKKKGDNREKDEGANQLSPKMGKFEIVEDRAGKGEKEVEVA